MNSRQMDWEHRLDVLECQIQQYEDEREQVLVASSSPEVISSVFSCQVRDALPDRSLPVSAQLEAALRLLVDRSKALKLQELKIVTLEAENSSLKASIHIESDKLRTASAELLDLQISKMNQRAQEALNSTSVGYEAFQLSKEREEEIIKIAEDTISSLRRQLVKKDETIQKYRDKIRELWLENEKQKEVFPLRLIHFLAR